MDNTNLANLRRNWIIGHGISWSLAFIVLTLNIRSYLVFMPLLITILMVGPEWIVLNQVIGRPVLFFVITVIGWLIGTFLFIWLASGITQVVDPFRLLLLESLLWGGFVGLGRTMAWSARARRAYLWLYTEWIFIFIVLVTEAALESAASLYWPPSYLLTVLAGLVAGFVYGALTSYILLWQVRHPIFDTV